MFNNEYWLLHKKIINEKLSQLDNSDYYGVTLDAESELAIKIKADTHKEVMERLRMTPVAA